MAEALADVKKLKSLPKGWTMEHLDNYTEAMTRLDEIMTEQRRKRELKKAQNSRVNDRN